MEQISLSLKFLIENLDNKVDEDSPVFKQVISKLGYEGENIPLSINYIDAKKYIDVDEDKFYRHYSFIDAQFHKKISLILSDCDNLDKMAEVCLILKNAFYSELKSNLNAIAFTNQDNLINEFRNIIGFLGKDIQEVTFKPIHKGSLKIKDPFIINYLAVVLLEKISEYFDHIDYDEEDDLITRQFLGKTDYFDTLDFYVDIAIESLLNLLVISGQEDSFMQSTTRKYSNKQLSIASKLLESFNLVERDGREDYDQAKFLRHRINRKHEKSLKQMKKIKIEGLQELINEVLKES